MKDWRELGDVIASSKALGWAAEAKLLTLKHYPTQRHHSIPGGREIDLQLSEEPLLQATSY